MRRLTSIIPLEVELSQEWSSDEHSQVPLVLAASGGVKYGNELSKQLQKTIYTVATHTTNNALLYTRCCRRSQPSSGNTVRASTCRV